MDNIFFILALLSIGAVAVSLFGGLFVMGRGGENDAKISNKMMRLRVLFQACAIIFLFLAYLTKNS